jgi:membrane protease YdiL (CAAX protease family)
MMQQELVIFTVAIILSGWVLGFFLARSMRGKTQPSPKVILISLLAVAMPTIMAFALAESAERSALLGQFRLKAEFLPIVVALIAPFLIALAGHVGGALVQRRSIPLPGKATLAQVAGMIPLLLVWALLEEIGWRGYLYAHLAMTGSALGSAALVGLLWGVWHAPQMFFNDQLKEHFKGRIFIGMTLWILQCVLLGCIMGWLQTASGSFLFPAFSHALINLFGNLSDGALGKEKDGLFAGTSGVFACATSLLITLILFVAL